MRVLGVNALFHDPAAAEEERFSRRKHGKRPVPFSAWELPEHLSEQWQTVGVTSARRTPVRRRSSPTRPTWVRTSGGPPPGRRRDGGVLPVGRRRPRPLAATP
ncbi:hypothetical protein AB0A76_27165 [Streptomyces exfoliatus]|uniref:Uncharacterized protein n=1 Tax=Streptomyces exfoliatus TaxID=1905 RepID=A0ABV3D301_STREX